MIKRLIRNDIKQNKLLSCAAVFFMAVSAMLLALAVLLFSGLAGAIGSLAEEAGMPDYMQMHAGVLDEAVIARFAEAHEEVREWQLCRFLNLDNSRITLGGRSLADSTQDNGLCVQGERFDYLLDEENNRPEVLPGEVYVPVCYRNRYDLMVGETMVLSDAGGGGDIELLIAGFLRDAQMNSMMASSKRFLVSETDYEAVKAYGSAHNSAREEYLIEFLLRDGADTNLFGAAYAAEGLPADGPAITGPLIYLMNALSDGTVIFVLFLFSIVILAISMLCIGFMLSLQTERDKREVGMLKALGIGNTGIRRIYFAKYILFSGCGGAVGLFAAFLLKAPLEKQMRELYGMAEGGWQTAVLGCLAVALAEEIILLSVRGALKKTEKLSALEALFSVQKRKTGRVQYLMIGLVTAACTVLVLVPQNLYSTLSDPGFVTYMGIGNAEIRMDVRQAEEIDDVTGRVARMLERDMQVETYAVLRTRSCPAVLADGRTVNLTVETGDCGIFPVSCLEGMLPKTQTEIALSAMNAKELGVAVGDPLRLVTGGKETEYTVCGIYSDITNGGKTAKAYQTDDDAPVIWSVLYVSLRESAKKEQWMRRYRQPGVDVTDIADYVRDTYGQTLGQLRLASCLAAVLSAFVTAVVTVLFMRLLVDKDRYEISLQKALGYTAGDLKRIYFTKGLFPVAAGVFAGLFTGNLSGERLCGTVMKIFGADGFAFVISWERILVLVPAVILGAAVPAVAAGIAEIGRIKACECCMGRE